MTKIVAFFGIFILTIYAVYLVFLVAKVITHKKPKEQEKQSLCDSCTHLVRKGGGLKIGKYKCEFLNGSYHESPVCCQIYERREEKKEPTDVNTDD